MTDTNLESLSPAKRALFELRSARARIDELERVLFEPVAIVGAGLRFPGGVVDLESLWRLLAEGRDAITPIPEDRWDVAAFLDPDPDVPGRMYTRHGGFLPDVDRFDSRFFGIAPREAAALDPQQRLLLEITWEALESAGIAPGSLPAETGVFVAASNADYGRLVFNRPEVLDSYASTGNNFAVGAGRLSYFLGLKGPSLAVDSACSGSLVAVHLACQSLRTGESRVALAGGVNLILGPEINIAFSKARMLAPDGRCKTFDAAADGYVRGEGAGIVVLKPLRTAVAAGDRILAVIRGSAVNQDGSSGGLTVPNGPSQEAVIRQALAASRLGPDDLDCVEAHGTGTSLGDPIEAHALAAVFGQRPPGRPLVVGSIKTNIGHLEAAAGIAGLLKGVASLRHGRIPAHLHFSRMNPHIHWGETAVEIPTAGRDWVRGGEPRRIGVSSFGFSGTNAHVVLEEGPVEPPRNDVVAGRPFELLAVSARSEQALDRLIDRYRETAATREAGFGELARAANLGRAHLPIRAAFIGESGDRAARVLAGEPVARGASTGSPDLGFLFTGQGAQRLGMGADLYRHDRAFREALDRCAAILSPRLDRPLPDILFGADQAAIDDTRYTQPVLFSFEVALAAMWRSWGVTPAMILGHSVGEYAAFTVAGVWTLEDGLALITERGRLTGSLGPGYGMAAVQGSLGDIVAAIEPYRPWLSIAAENGPESVVLSGRLTELDLVVTGLAAEGRRVKRLPISHGFHSPQMDQIADEFAELAVRAVRAEPDVPTFSSVTGERVGLAQLRSPRYWRDQLSGPVEFRKAMGNIEAAGYRHFLEIGPAPILLGMGRECLTAESVWIPSLRRDRGEWEQVTDSAGQLYALGVDLAWPAFHPGGRTRFIELPSYPFDRERHWITPRKTDPVARPAWKTIVEAGSWQAGQGRFDLDLSRYRTGWEALDRLTTESIVAAFHRLGLYRSVGETHSLKSILEAGRIEPGFQRLIGRWLGKLTGAGRLAETATGYRAIVAFEAPPLAALRDEVTRIFGPDRYLLDYILDCGEHLTDYLTGSVSTLETLFPGGSFQRAENVYQHAPLSSYFAGIGRAIFEAFVRARPGQPIRSLEIGAGTGATTAALAAVMPAEPSTYHFTDLSDFFLNHARAKFAGTPGMRFSRFDAEVDGSSQGFPPGSMDVVVATNVVHATRDVRETLRRVHELLAPGGILILCEVTTYLSWYDITTALIEGWQLFDDGLRGDHPLIAGDRWVALLEETGFERVAAWPEAGSPAEVLGQHVIAAMKAGAAGPRDWIDLPGAHESVQDGDPPEAESLAAQVAAADPADRHELLVGLVRRELARALRLGDPDSLDRRRGVVEFGIDSLMAVELRNRLAAALDLIRPLPATLVFDHPNIEAIARFLAAQALGLGETSGEAAAAQPDVAVTNLDDLTDAEAELLLLRKLESL